MACLRKRTVVSALVALALIFSTTLAACTPKVVTPRVYIALGDSVAAGFGVEPEDRYADLFYEKLKSEDLADEYYNYAVTGYTAAMLLDSLKSTEDLEQFADASVITLNIGGNNILVPFKEHFPDIDELAEGIAELVDYLARSKDVMSVALELADEAKELLEDFSLFDIVELAVFLQETIPVLQGVTDALHEGTELYIVSQMPVLFGIFPSEMEADLQEGIDAFAADFAEIIGWLETNAPNAVIIVNTVYNPIPKDALGLSSGLHNRADGLVKAINDIIFEGAETSEYLVSDVCGRFDNEPNMADILNFNLDIEAMTLNFDMIHPNEVGQGIIASLNYEALARYRAEGENG